MYAVDINRQNDKKTGKDTNVHEDAEGLITALYNNDNDNNNCTHQHRAHPQSVVYYCQLPHRITII